MTGLAALLDREVSTPAAPEVQLVDNCVKISLEDLVIDKQALSKVRKTAFLQCNWLNDSSSFTECNEYRKIKSSK